ncbi:MAG: DNA repair protein RecN [Hyphomicrobiales bacterium]
MLSALSIRDIVLIDKLDIELGTGLAVLTGETGAGKSILLDALGLALGSRGDASLVRPGVERGMVTAAFELSASHPVFAQLQEAGIEADGELILRRIQSSDGRSRASINDQPVSVSLLRAIGRELTEIHGQHDDRAMVDPKRHRALVDAFGGLGAQTEDVSSAWKNYHQAETDLTAHEERLERAEVERDYLEHAVAELTELAPETGEENALADRRQLMMNAEKFADCLNDVETAVESGNLEAQLNAGLRKLERRQADAAGKLDGVIAALDRFLVELGEVKGGVREAQSAFVFDARDQEKVDNRLFALKDAARKYRCRVDELPGVAERLANELATLEHGSSHLAELREKRDALRETYFKKAKALSAARRKAGRDIEKAVMGELAPLKLEKATFHTQIESGDSLAGEHGIDRVEFTIAANPGSQAGSLAKVASGGELSRVMLALKVVLAAKGSAPTLVFDEIDTGVGGATAAAVGERLARLSKSLQTLAVTHSPQVAARADSHYVISKMEEVGGEDARMVTKVSELGSESRREEIARMLSGASVTEEARAQAERLLADTG